MAFCPNCGTNVPDPNQQYCSSCNAPLVATPPQSVASANFTPNTPYANPAPSAVIPPQHSMKWFKFLIYFWLFFFALACIGNAITCFGMRNTLVNQFVSAFKGTGIRTNSVSEYLELLSGAHILYCICGIGYLIIGALAIVTRFSLAKFKANGPAFFFGHTIGYLIVNFLTNVANNSAVALFSKYISTKFTAAAAIAFKNEAYTNLLYSFIACVIVALVVMLPHKTYFKKRESMFKFK